MKPSAATNNSSYTTMESLALPRELYWDGKLEPSTPPSNELFSIIEPIENWLYDENFATGLTIETLDFKLESDSPIEILNSEDLVVEYDLTKEHWNGVKLHTTAEQVSYTLGTPLILQDNGITKVENIYDGSLFGSSGLDNAILTQLTPPHSPPRHGGCALPTFQLVPNNEQQIVNGDFNPILLPAPQVGPPVDFVPAVQNNTYATWQGTNSNGTEASNSDFSDDNIALETQIVDEIVKSFAKELLPDWNDESDTQSSYSNQSSIDTCTDEDWVPSAGSSPAYSESGNPATENDDTKKAAKKRTRPYGRGVEDRKIRKKEQNKNAATRYRQKKKLEMEIVLTEEQQLTKRNQELKQTLSECEREEQYLTKLIREFYQKKKA